jgi:hypothetical protein
VEIEFAEVANMQGVALFEGPVPMKTAAEVAPERRQHTEPLFSRACGRSSALNTKPRNPPSLHPPGEHRGG